MSSLVSLHDISLSFDGRKVLDRVSLDLDSGQITTIIGPNGAGKSTLLKVILGLQSADEGQLVKAPKLRIGYVPQKAAWDESLPLSVERFLKLARRYSKTELRSVVRMLGIDALLPRQVVRLSGGELQRVLLARALIGKPQLLVLDEPVQGVDINGQTELYELIAKIAQQLECAVLMVSHDLHLVMAGTDQVICLNHHVCCTGAPENVAQHPEFARLFGQKEREQLAVYTHHHQCDDHDHQALSSEAK